MQELSNRMKDQVFEIWTLLSTLALEELVDTWSTIFHRTENFVQKCEFVAQSIRFIA